MSLLANLDFLGPLCYTRMMVRKLVKKVEFAALAGVSQGRVTRLIAKELRAAVVGRRIDKGHPDAVAYLQKRQVKRAGTVETRLDARYLEAVTLCIKSGRWSQGAIVKGLKIGEPRAKRILVSMQASGIVPNDLTLVTSSKPSVEILESVESTSKTVGLEPFSENMSVNGKIATPTTNGASALPTVIVEPEIPEDIMQYADFTIQEVVSRFATMTAFQDHLKAINTLEGINGKRLKNAQEAGTLVSRSVVETHIIGPMDAMLVQMLQDLPKTLSLQVANWISAGDDSLKIEKAIRELLTGFISPMKKRVERVVRKEMKGKPGR